MSRRSPAPVALVLMLALAACTDGVSLGGSAPAPGGSGGPVIAGGAKVLQDTGEVRVIQQALPKGAKAWLRLPFKQFYLTAPGIYQIKAQLLVAEATEVPAITWTSSAPAVVSVSKGLLQGMANGVATITAEAAGQKVTMTVLVVDREDVPVSQSAFGSGTAGSGSSGAVGAGGLIEAAAGEEGELIYARQGASALMYNSGSALLVAGGSDGAKALNSKEAAPLIRVSDGTNVGIDSDFVLERQHLFQIAREGLTATLAGMHLYVFGGAKDDTSVEMLDPSARLPFQPSERKLVTSRSYHGTVDTEDMVLLIGGEDATGTPLKATEGAEKQRSRDVKITALGEFQAGGDLIQARAGAGVTALGDWVFALGGRTDGGNTNSIERAPIEGGRPGTWIPVEGTRMVQGRAYFQVLLTDDNYVYAIGGLGTTGEPLDTIERARLNTDGSLTPFELVGRLRTARSRFAATVAPGPLLVVAGGKTATGVTRDVEYIDTFELSPEAFARPTASPTPSATPTPAATATPAPTAAPTATPTPSPTPTPTATPTASPTPTATPTATATPG